MSVNCPGMEVFAGVGGTVDVSEGEGGGVRVSVIVTAAGVEPVFKQSLIKSAMIKNKAAMTRMRFIGSNFTLRKSQAALSLQR